MKRIASGFGIALALGILGCSPTADDPAPPETSMAAAEEGEEEMEGVPELPSRGMGEVVAALEAAGHTGIVEVEFEEGVWEVSRLQDGELLEFRVDPATLEILAAPEEEAMEATEGGEEEEETPEPPPDGAPAPSAVVAALAAAGYPDVIEMELEDGLWEVEVVQDGERVELTLDPVSLEIQAALEDPEAPGA